MFRSFLDRHPTWLAGLLLILGLSNAYFAYDHRHSPLWLVFDGCFSVAALAGCVLVLIMARKRLL